jgi:CBS domain-containing protein
MQFEDQLQSIARDLAAQKVVAPVTVREFLSWFAAKRRGYEIVRWIRSSLKDASLTTEPDFESAFLDSEIAFRLVTAADVYGAVQSGSATFIADAANLPAALPAAVGTVSESDPTYRISKLKAANTKPVVVSPNATIGEAVTIMLANDFSQLPVMNGEYTVKGVISWQSIGTRMSLGKSASFVRELMDAPQEVRADSSIFQAIPIIAEHQYALVRDAENRITGILTSTDLNLQFQQLAEPFLQLGEIETQIRQILANRLSAEELRQAHDPADAGHRVESVSDLTFGDYVRLAQHPERWAKLRLPIDQKVFCEKLEGVRIIRNDVMHFDTDGIPLEDLEKLREFARFLRLLQRVGVT